MCEAQLNQWLIIVLNVINATNFVVVNNPGYPDYTSGKPAAPTIKNTELFDPSMTQPYSVQATGGVKHEISNGFAVSADYLYNKGTGQLRRRDLNAPVDGTTVRPDATIGRVLIHESTGRRQYHALILSAERRTYGTFSIPVNRPGALGRNAFRGPDFARFDVRVSKVIRFGKQRVELLAEAFNATNRVNFGSYTSSIQSNYFSLPQSANNPRQVQPGIRFNF